MPEPQLVRDDTTAEAGRGPHPDVRAPTGPRHRTTWRPCWSPGGGPGTTAHSQAGAGRHSACSPWGQVLSEIRAPHPPGWRDQEDPLPGPPHSGRLLLRLGSLRDHQPEAHGPPGPRAPAKPQPLSSLQGVYSFWVICLCLRKRGLSKNLRTASNKPSSDQCRETVSEARQKSDASGLPAPGPRCPLPAPCARARQAGTLGPAAGWGTHTPALGLGAGPGAPGLGAGPGAGFRAGEFQVFLLLKAPGQPGCRRRRGAGGRETDRQWVLGYDAHRCPPPAPLPLGAPAPGTAAAAASPASAGLREECVACLCPERGPEGPASARRGWPPQGAALRAAP